MGSVQYRRTASIRADAAASAQALLETQLDATIPGANLIFKPVFGGVMKPVIKTTTDYMCQFIMNTVNNHMFHSVVNMVQPDVDAMLGVTITANLTNILVDTISFSLTKALAFALTQSIGPYVTSHLDEKLPPILHKILDMVLKRKIPNELEGTVPMYTGRIAQLILGHSLTRSVTHAIVPALTHSLSHRTEADLFCHTCFYNHKDCHLCSFSPQTVYYHLYHATYFSDYYSDYYADYYVQAMQKVDIAQNPRTDGTA